MAQIISFISGKGGCGKTTLALSMAKTLSDCNYTVLCIDCDLATNGATYFFENYYEHPVTTLSDILTYDPDPGFRNDTDELGRRLWEEQERQKLGPFDAKKEGFYFVPTATQYPSSNDDESKWHYENLEAYILTASKKFDVIICDCQAGYTKAMETVLSVSTIDVIITEPDPVSGSAVRVLRERITNSKASNQLRNRNWSPYLLQNKVRLQFERDVIRFERDVVNIEGTRYVVLPHHLDRDSVYETFSNLQIPNLDCGVDYAEEILRFCKAVLSLKDEDCKAYQDKILRKRRKEAISGLYNARIEQRNLIFRRNIWWFWLIVGCALIVAPTGLLVGISISIMPSGMSVDPYTLMILAPVLSGMWLALFAMKRITSWNFRISKIREEIDRLKKNMELGL